MSDSEQDEVTYSDNEGSLSRSEGSRSPSPESRPAKSSRKSRKVQDDSDDDDELRDSEEAEDDEDFEYNRRRKKRRKGNEFIIDEAEVDEDADEDDENWDEEDGVFGGVNEAEEAGRTAQDLEAERRRKNRGMGDLGFEDGMDAQAIEDYYLKRYNEDTAALAHFGDGGEEMSDEITQQTLLPSVKKDPNLWMVKCVIGTEKECLLRLMNKFIAYQDTDEPLQIRSVVVPDHLKGYIYVEAFKQTHVKQAIEGITNLRLGQYTQQMVPFREMTDVLRVVKEQIGLKEKQWVRLKKGLYKDDLAQVDFVEMAQNMVSLKLIPRIDYTRMRGALRTNATDDGKNKLKKKRPPAKLFDPEKVRSIGGEISNDGDFLMFEGNRYSRKGYLYKNFVMNSILVEGVKPTLPELEKFEEAPEGMMIEVSGSEKDDQTHNFSTGDNVEVTEGELVNLQGTILAVDGPKITIKPNHKDLTDNLEFQASELRKYFRQGDRVRVIGGRHEGDTGLIVRVSDKVVVLFSDLTMHELRVLPRDLQLSTEMATGVDSLGQFQFGDLVQLDAQTVGVIVQIQRETFQVLNMHGKVHSVRPVALQKKRENKNAVALDSEQNAIQKRDIVKVIDGPHNGRQGEIKHLYRNFAFLHSRMMLENGGIFVCKCRHLVLAGGTRAGGPGAAGGGRSGAAGMPGFMSPRIASPMHPSQGGRGGGRGGFGGRGRGRGMVGRDRDLIGQTIKITQGPYKSHIGIVKDATETTARVELHSKCQTIMVDRSRIAIVGGPARGSISTYTRTPNYSGTGTPMYGANTPGHGGRTPMYGSQTPMYEAGGRTPHYGSQTPSHGEDGSRTPGRSGAWDPTITNTPSANRDYDDYSFEDTSPSPNYNPGTPGYTAQESPSSNPYTPATPGSVYNPQEGYSPYQPSPSPSAGYQSTPSPINSYVPTPSPGQNYQPTPSPGYGAPSPLNYSPMTPGQPSPYTPQTPGASMGDALGQSDWYSPDLEVIIRDTHEDTGLSGQVGIIRGVTPGMCSVFLPDEDRTVSIAAEHLQPVQPTRGNKVKVILGEDRDSTGLLLSIDSQEGVVKLDNNGDVKMLQLKYLCKIKDDA